MLKPVWRRLLKMTTYGMVHADGVADEILRPTFSNVVVAIAYDVSRSIYEFTRNIFLKRAVLFDTQVDPQQAVVLKRLIDQAQRKNMQVLEIGSWMGFSTKVLGQVVKENNGDLYCVDLWGDHLDLEQAETLSQGRLERRARMFDIFRLFDKNVKNAGLKNTVHPLIMSSHQALGVIADNSMDFIFIDADHRYSPVKKDVEMAYPKLKVGGILCGHDCECRIQDIDKDFLEKHCEQDYVHGNIYQGRGVHCGVIKAVGEIFPKATIDKAIWYIEKK